MSHLDSVFLLSDVLLPLLRCFSFLPPCFVFPPCAGVSVESYLLRYSPHHLVLPLFQPSQKVEAEREGGTVLKYVQ
ncbi:hypothetical protein C8R45DRAFT_1037410 [Mycena sanguinolenta]|nr:hypothetical protein C8R45DRAFT_1037410 [Mycena sanguinolenta]